ncbi:uncharacterized protein LACBIDRAFT_329833 [Laccaria bicolor S238N-H82]|uniref:Predicted protein n=1 Tax=Laccaria bicolor (strain S238N-H82 / ATCC MYA-4686) TaxID=486041 RepID=B0DJD6_LACBS|nr:uncharacterized protein LACBIDRAFT_329833 [Laccaria bicolor S238N-H82]EDR05503.1 predicted protein [Laccaria bicolor S238N-H82]|eukprot:XP_001884061.1 predicted protein [Laccaria bicolor S238N-H82]
MVSSEGTLLLANICGNTAENSPEAFSLPSSEEIVLMYYHPSFPLPQLLKSIALLHCVCNTSRIINDKQPLAKYLATLGLQPLESPTTPTGEALPESEEKLLDVLEEVDLLAGLAVAQHPHLRQWRPSANPSQRSENPTSPTYGDISLTIPYQHILLTMELRPRPRSTPSPSPGCHGRFGACRRASKHHIPNFTLFTGSPPLHFSTSPLACKAHKEFVCMFINPMEELAPIEVNECIQMELEDSLEEALERAVDGCSEDLGDLLSGVVKGYKPSLKKPDKPKKKAEARYHGLLPFVDLFDVQLAGTEGEKFCDQLKKSGRLMKRPHLIIVHRTELPALRSCGIGVRGSKHPALHLCSRQAQGEHGLGWEGDGCKVGGERQEGALFVSGLLDGKVPPVEMQKSPKPWSDFIITRPISAGRHSPSSPPVLPSQSSTYLPLHLSTNLGLAFTSSATHPNRTLATHDNTSVTGNSRETHNEGNGAVRPMHCLDPLDTLKPFFEAIVTSLRIQDLWIEKTEARQSGPNDDFIRIHSNLLSCFTLKKKLCPAPF